MQSLNELLRKLDSGLNLQLENIKQALDILEKCEAETPEEQAEQDRLFEGFQFLERCLHKLPYHIFKHND